MKLMHATLAVALCCMTVQAIGSVTWSMTTTSLFPLNGVVNGHFVGINPFVLVDVKTGAASNITWPAPLSQGAGLLFTSENRYVIYQAQEPVVATAFYDSVTRSGWVSAENLSCAVIASPVTGFTTKAAKNLVLVPSQGFVNPGSGWFPAVFVAAFDMATGASAYPPAAPYNQQFVVGRPHLARDDAYAAWLVPSASGVNVSLLDAATGNTMWAQSIVAPLSAGMSVAEVSSPLVTDVNVVFSVWTVGATQNTSVTILYALSKATGAVEVVHSLRASAGCSFVANSTNVKEKTLVLSCMTAPPPNEFFAAGSVQKLYYTNFSVVWKRSIDHPTDTTSYDATANIITTFSFYHVFYLDAADGKIVWSSGNGGYAVQMAYSWGRQGLVLNQTNPTLTLYSISL